MNKIYIYAVFSLFFSTVVSSTLISGKVLDEKGMPIIYANVYLENTFDGVSTNQSGEFSFFTNEVELQKLIVSYIGYETYNEEIFIDINKSSSFNLIEITLKEAITKASEVVITAGSFGASDDEKVIVLDPVDIVSVASSRGEISGALEALPGTQPQADKEGIYVRGGDASEAKQIVDGMLIQNPYFSDVPDIPQRGRFEPFDFQGTAFSQGGYSAQHGQALSSIVDLKTWTRFGDFNANTFGILPIGISYGRAYGNDSTICGVNIDYGDHSYFQDFNNNGFLSDFINNRINLSKPPIGRGISTNYSKKFDSGVYKYIGKYTDYELATSSAAVGTDFDLDNRNLFILTTYKGKINKNLNIDWGLSYSENNSIAGIDINVDEFLQPFLGLSNIKYNFNSNDDLLQLRTVLTQKSSIAKIKLGFHLFNQNSDFYNVLFKDTIIVIDNPDYDPYNPGNINPTIESPEILLPDENYSGKVVFNEFLSAAFTELDFKFSKKFAINTGIRFENSKLLGDSYSISPRFSMAYKLGQNSQCSYAYGKFYQTPELGFDLWYRQNNINFKNLNIENLKFERAIHHIFNYEWKYDEMFLRLETYHKKYKDLITLHTETDCNENEDLCRNTLLNNGNGYSQGFEVFWRYDYKNTDGIGQDVFLTYSYLDSKRSFKEYLHKITPSFASKHKVTFSFNNTFYLKDGKSRFSSSVALTYTSGFPYYDYLNNIESESKPYFSLDIGGSYLPNIENGFLVLFFNISNPAGYRNSFGYEYFEEDGSYLYPPKEKLPSSLRTIFIGCFMFFSIDKK